MTLIDQLKAAGERSMSDRDWYFHWMVRAEGLVCNCHWRPYASALPDGMALVSWSELEGTDDPFPAAEASALEHARKSVLKHMRKLEKATNRTSDA